MKTINTIITGSFVIVISLTGALKAQPLIKDVLQPSTVVQLNGYVADRLDESLQNRILEQDVDRLIEPFKSQNRTETRMWQSEFWGKWFTSAVLAYKYKPDPKLKQVLDHAITGLLATQTPDGYIGNYAEAHHLDQWDIWGRKYCMLGLLAYYELTGDKKSLNGAARIADHLIEELKKGDGLIVTKGNYRGMAASSVLEPVCLLYTFSKNKKYLDFAKEIVRQWETPQGPRLISKSNVNVSQRFPRPKNWYSPEQGQKAYEMMSCYEGLLELYRLTGDPSYKKAVEDAWENIRGQEINIAGSGASAEMWFGGKAIQNIPIHHYQETCVTATWIKLSEQLLRLTGEAKYGDEVERAYYNALLGSTGNHGATWAKYTPLNGQRLPGSAQCGMGLNCCEASGPRGLFTIPTHIITQRKEGVQINYFVDGTFLFKTPEGRPVTVIQHTTYPQTGNVEMELTVDQPETMDLWIRIPAWSKVTTLSVNGENIGVSPGTLSSIKRNWKSGDKIQLELDMSGRVVEAGVGLQSRAIQRGPIVLARDSRFEGSSLEAVLRPVVNAKGIVELNPVSSTAGGPFMAFEASFIPESYTEVPHDPVHIILCDYASAGNNADNSFYRVWWPQLLNPRDDK